jgi:type IV secretory pathway VirB10-like protein
MKSARTALLALACLVPLVASAQWQWIDKSGRKVFSDQAPPPEIAADKILKRPGPRGRSVDAQPAPETAAAAAAAAPALPKVTGKDKVLDEKKKQMDAAEAEKKKAQEEKVAAMRAENCTRARSAKATYDTGVRISRVNDKGEREILDDKQRAAELKHLDGVIARDCKSDRQ